MDLCCSDEYQQNSVDFHEVDMIDYLNFLGISIVQADSICYLKDFAESTFILQGNFDCTC